MEQAVELAVPVVAVQGPVEHHQTAGQAAVGDGALQAEGLGGGQAGHAIGGQGRGAQADGGADDVVQMAMLADVQGVPVIGAKAQVGRQAFGQKWCQCVQILGDRAFTDQHAHALLTKCDCNVQGRCGLCHAALLVRHCQYAR